MSTSVEVRFLSSSLTSLVSLASFAPSISAGPDAAPLFSPPNAQNDLNTASIDILHQKGQKGPLISAPKQKIKLYDPMQLIRMQPGAPISPGGRGTGPPKYGVDGTLPPEFLLVTCICVYGRPIVV